MLFLSSFYAMLFLVLFLCHWIDTAQWFIHISVAQCICLNLLPLHSGVNEDIGNCKHLHSTIVDNLSDMKAREVCCLDSPVVLVIDCTLSCLFSYSVNLNLCCKQLHSRRQRYGLPYFHILLYSVFPWILQKVVSLFVSLLWRCCLQCIPYFTSTVNSMRSCWMTWWLRTKPCVNSCQHCYICLAPWLLR